MCLAVPGKIVEISDTRVTIDMNGIMYQAAPDLVADLHVGDYVLIHSGYILEKIDPGEAEETLKLVEELQEVMK